MHEKGILQQSPKRLKIKISYKCLLYLSILSTPGLVLLFLVSMIVTLPGMRDVSSVQHQAGWETQLGSALSAVTQSSECKQSSEAGSELETLYDI